MGIVNRTLDPSQQTILFNFAEAGQIVTGVTLTLGMVASPSTIQMVTVATQGASGQPSGSLEILRFIAGAGSTTISGLGASFNFPSLGVSGAINVSLVAEGSTLLNLVAGDILQIRHGAANTALNSPCVTVVMQRVQDIVSYFGQSI